MECPDISKLIKYSNNNMKEENLIQWQYLLLAESRYSNSFSESKEDRGHYLSLSSNSFTKECISSNNMNNYAGVNNSNALSYFNSSEKNNDSNESQKNTTTNNIENEYNNFDGECDDIFQEKKDNDSYYENFYN